MMKKETAIAHILKECKECKEDHTEDCIINVIRSCYEVSLIGDTHPYEGSTIQYLMFLKEHYPDQAACIADVYKSALTASRNFRTSEGTTLSSSTFHSKKRSTRSISEASSPQIPT